MMPKTFYLGNQGRGHGLGCWVFTIPVSIRSYFKSKKALQQAGKFIRDLLKKHHFPLGLSRWHFFGDGQIWEDKTGTHLNMGEYHPHLNALVPGKWVSDKEMKAVKDAWKQYLSNVAGVPVDIVDVWFQYYKEKGKWWHKAVYLTRSTFKNLEGNTNLAKTFYNFRNVVYWGWGKKEERESREGEGRQVLKACLDSLPQDQKFSELSSEQAVTLSLLTDFFCPECFYDGSHVHLQTKLHLDTASPVILACSSLTDYVEKDCGGGFYSLKPMTQEVILKLKPMSDDAFVLTADDGLEKVQNE